MNLVCNFYLWITSDFFFLRDLLYFAMVPATAWQQYLLSRCLQFTVWFHLLYDNMWKVHGNIIENTYLLFTHWLFRLAEITECTQDIQSVVFSSVLESEVQHKSIPFYDSVEVSNPPILVISTLGVFLFFFFFFLWNSRMDGMPSVLPTSVFRKKFTVFFWFVFSTLY